MVHCWASGWPVMRAECVVSREKIEAATLPGLAVKLLALGAPDDWYMLVRFNNELLIDSDKGVRDWNGSHSGYQSATIRAFSQGRVIPMDTRMNWNGRFEWMREFGI